MANIGKAAARVSEHDSSTDRASPGGAPQASKDGLTCVFEGPDVKIDIVLVHGLNGHPVKTWTNASTKFYWPIALGKALANARILVYGYDTDISPSVGSNHTRIRSIAYALLNEIRNERLEDNELERPLVLIGHSLGGLVIKHALILAAHDPGNDRGLIYRSVKSVMFFGTPNAGSIVDQKKRVQLLKKMAIVAFTEVPPKIEAALELHSDELLDLGDDFRKIDICKNNRLLIYSFYETLDTKLLGARVVDEFSARVAASEEEALPINADHSDMVKFSGTDDKNFKNVVATVKRLQRPANSNMTLLPAPSFLISGHSVMPFNNEHSTFGAVTASGNFKKTSYFKIPNESRVSKFIGRSEVLDDIRTAFSPVISSNATEPIGLVLIGMGGVGKTQIVLEYCRQAYRAKHFETIFWINANSEESVIASLLRIRGFIDQDASVHGQNSGDAKSKVETVLSSFDTWPHPFLLVYDNLDDPNFDNILEYTPSMGCGALLFTSRLRAADHLFENAINVDLMTKNEAIELLRVRSGLQEASANSDIEQAGELVHTLDHLPLAIDQAAAYIKASGGNVSFKKFLEDYEERKKEVLQHVPTFWRYKSIEEGREKRRDLSVFTTWELSLNFLGTDSEDQEKKTRFLTVAAFLGGPRISKVFFKNYTNVLSPKEMELDRAQWTTLFHNEGKFSDSQYRKVLMELNNLSLIRGFMETEIGDLRFSFHPLVQEWAVYRLEVLEQQLNNAVALKLLKHLFIEYAQFENCPPNVLDIVTDGVSNSIDDKHVVEAGRDMGLELISHIRTCVYQDQLFNSGPGEDFGDLNSNFALFLVQYGEVDLAIKLHEQRVRSLQDARDERREEYLFLEMSLCKLLVVQKARAEDIQLLEQHLHEFRSMKGKDHPHALSGHFWLIHSYLEIGDRLRAQQESLELCSTLNMIELDIQNLSVMVALQLSEFLIASGYLTQAEDLLNQARWVLPPLKEDEPLSMEAQKSQSLHFELCLAQGRPKDAEEILVKSINANSRRFGHTHGSTIITKGSQLSRCFAMQGRWEDAANALEPFALHLEATEGFGSEQWKNYAFLLAEYWLRAFPDDLDRPRELIGRVVEKQTMKFGSDHRKTILARLGAAVAYFKGGQKDLAYGILEKLFKVDRERFAPDDSLRIDIEDHVASCVDTTNAKAEAVAQIVDALSFRIKYIQTRQRQDDALLSHSTEHLATLLLRCKRYDEALEPYKITLQLEEKVNGTSNEKYWNIYVKVAQCYMFLFRYEEAIEIYSKVVEWRRKTLRISNQDTLDIMGQLASSYDMVERREEARKVYLEVYNITKETLGPEHSQTVDARANYAYILLTMGRNAEAAEEALAVLSWTEQARGIEDKSTAAATLTLAYSLHEQNSAASMLKAATYYRRSVTWHERFAPDSENLMNVWSLMATCLASSFIGRYAEAAQYRRKAVGWLELNCKHNDPRTLAELEKLGNEYARSKNLQQAIDVYSRLLALLDASIGDKNPRTLKISIRLGEFLYHDEQCGEAKRVWTGALRGCEVTHGPYHAQTARTIGLLHTLATTTEDWLEAERISSRQLQLLKDSENTTEDRLLQQTHVVALMRLKAGKASEAEPDLAHRVSLRSEKFGPNHPMTIKACIPYAECLFSLEKHDMAAKYYSFVLSWSGATAEFWASLPDDLKKMYDGAKENLKISESAIAGQQTNIALR